MRISWIIPPFSLLVSMSCGQLATEAFDTPLGKPVVGVCRIASLLLGLFDRVRLKSVKRLSRHKDLFHGPLDRLSLPWFHCFAEATQKIELLSSWLLLCNFISADRSLALSVTALFSFASQSKRLNISLTTYTDTVCKLRYLTRLFKSDSKPRSLTT